MADTMPGGERILASLVRSSYDDLTRPTVYVASYCCDDFYCGCPGPGPKIGSHFLGVFDSEEAAAKALERAGVGNIGGSWVTPLGLNALLPFTAGS